MIFVKVFLDNFSFERFNFCIIDQYLGRTGEPIYKWNYENKEAKKIQS